MPSLTNLGVVVVDEQPYEIRRDDNAPLWIYEFAIEHPDPFLEFADVAALVEETLTAVWRGDVEDDGFNRLVLAAGIGPRDVVVLRAYARYLHQARSAYSQDYIEQTLRQHPSAARLLIDLFTARFDPAEVNREARVDEIGAAFGSMVDAITSLDQDRILRRFHNLITCTLRTNFFQRSDGGGLPPYLAFKLDPQHIDELPEPRPKFEIFAYSPRLEGPTRALPPSRTSPTSWRLREASGSEMPSRRAVPTGTTTRAWASPHGAHGNR